MIPYRGRTTNRDPSAPVHGRSFGCCTEARRDVVVDHPGGLHEGVGGGGPDEREPPPLQVLGHRHGLRTGGRDVGQRLRPGPWRSEEHTSELQSRQYLVCRLLLEKKKKENKAYVS